MSLCARLKTWKKKTNIVGHACVRLKMKKKNRIEHAWLLNNQLEREIKELAMPRARAYKTQIIYYPQMDLMDGFSIIN
jgi:hypothetical protein